MTCMAVFSSSAPIASAIDDPAASSHLRSDKLARQSLLGRGGRNVRVEADENDHLLLEARLEFASLELDELERVLAAQVGILESLKPGLQQAERPPQWTPTLWRP